MSVSPASPTIPFELASIQYWNWRVPSLQTSSDEPDASSVTIWPGPASGGDGDAVRAAVATEQTEQGSPGNEALSTPSTIGAESASMIRTSSMNHPSSPTTLSTAKKLSQVWLRL